MSSTNATKLRAIMEFFGITVTAIAKATGMSQTYVSRVLAPNDVLAGSSGFWSCLEKVMGQLVQDRQSQIFEVVPVDVAKAEDLKKSA